VLKLFDNGQSPVPLEELQSSQQMQAGLAKGSSRASFCSGVCDRGRNPDMLERGTVDLYISKPISRWELLLSNTAGP
jgi:hypothetical protein